MARPKKRSRDYRRPQNTREPKQSFLIVCEGEKTEPNYFRAFRVTPNIIDIDIRGLRYNTDSLVEETLRLKKGKIYDQVWCVFDRDNFLPHRFNRAIELARNNSIKVAYSNEAFEIWYLLHFDYHEARTPRSQYKKMLAKRLGYEYKKNSETIYEELKPKQRNAIKNSKKLLLNYSPSRPEQDNPSTTVHELVEELNKFLS